ncbi:MAG TPA: type II toxin-antitoxin system RelE/ParE family toxin [Allosphingosinicella sp.]
MKVSLTPNALADLKEIGRWIARDSPVRARSFVQDLTAASMSLGRHPRRFPVVLREGVSDVRKRVHHGYLIFYRVEAEAVQVIRIVQGSRDWAELFGVNEQDSKDPRSGLS